MKVLALHIRDTANAGDRASCPLDYFELQGCEVIFGDMRSPPDVRPDVVIYGGGSIVASPHFRRWHGAITIAWGVGHHERNRPWDDTVRAAHVRAASLCDLYFPREVVPGFLHVPCASCLHPVFDQVGGPAYPTVRYAAARRVAVPDPAAAPGMTNEDGDIVAAAAFLASGEIVVTSSYHGAYWAQLLGRKVEVVAWGSKFEHLPRLSLAACRSANRAAHRMVLQRLGLPWTGSSPGFQRSLTAI